MSLTTQLVDAALLIMLICSGIAEFFWEIGVEKTAGFAVLTDYEVKVVQLGGKKLVPASEVDRIEAELLAKAPSPKRIEDAKVLAAKSVASRRKRQSQK